MNHYEDEKMFYAVMDFIISEFKTVMYEAGQVDTFVKVIKKIDAKLSITPLEGIIEKAVTRV